MPRFRKKPVVIEAKQWHGPGDHAEVTRFLDTPEGDEAWTRSLANAWGDMATEFYGIRTLEGIMRVSPGDWIIKGIKGEYYPCKPDIFEQTYEAVE